MLSRASLLMVGIGIAMAVYAESATAGVRKLRRGLVLSTGHQFERVEPNDIHLVGNDAIIGELNPDVIRVSLNWAAIQGARCKNEWKYCRTNDNCSTVINDNPCVGRSVGNNCNAACSYQCTPGLIPPSSVEEARTRLGSFNWLPIKDAITIAECRGRPSKRPREIIVTIDGYPDWAGAQTTVPAGCVLEGNECKIDRQLPADRDADGPWAWFLHYAMEQLSEGTPTCGGKRRLNFEIINEPNQIGWIWDGQAGRIIANNGLAPATAEMIATAVRLAHRRYPAIDLNGMTRSPPPPENHFNGDIYAPGTAGNRKARTFTRKVMQELACKSKWVRNRIRSTLRWSQHNYEDVRCNKDYAERVLRELTHTASCKGHPGNHGKLRLRSDRAQFLYLTEGGAHRGSRVCRRTGVLGPLGQCQKDQENFRLMRDLAVGSSNARIRLWSNYYLHSTCAVDTGLYEPFHFGSGACDCPCSCGLPSMPGDKMPAYEWFKCTNPAAGCAASCVQ